jgi:leucyl aminopeptidase
VTRFSCERAGVGTDPGGDALVVLVVSGDGPAIHGPVGSLPSPVESSLTEALGVLAATGAPGELHRVPSLGLAKAPLLLAAGLGAPEPADADLVERLRRAAGGAARAARGRDEVVLLVPDLGLPAEQVVAALVEGWLLGDYRYERYRTNLSGPDPAEHVRVLLGAGADPARCSEVVRRTAVLAEVVCLARDLCNTPAGDLTPAAFAAAAADAAGENDLELQTWDEQALTDEGFGGLLTVGKGSVHPPRLVRIAWRPPGPSRGTVAVVGKGITFDSGGLSIKDKSSMPSMKADMAGAAAALAIVVGAAGLGLDVGVTAWLALAENMPDGGAVRPSDVYTSWAGRTVEVADTDAEGRLVLADAVAKASAETPDALVDIATLTGAHVPAIGAEHYAVVADDDALRDALLNAAEQAGEPAWALPVVPSLRRTFDSRIADLRNTGEPGRGRVVVGAMFVREFLGEGIPWAHLDIAGPTTNHGDATGYSPSGATGVTVRTLLRLLDTYPTTTRDDDA